MKDWDLQGRTKRTIVIDHGITWSRVFAVGCEHNDMRSSDDDELSIAQLIETVN